MRIISPARRRPNFGRAHSSQGTKRSFTRLDPRNIPMTSPAPVMEGTPLPGLAAPGPATEGGEWQDRTCGWKEPRRRDASSPPTTNFSALLGRVEAAVGFLPAGARSPDSPTSVARRADQSSRSRLESCGMEKFPARVGRINASLCSPNDRNFCVSGHAQSVEARSRPTSRSWGLRFDTYSIAKRRISSGWEKNSGPPFEQESSRQGEEGVGCGRA